MSHINTEIGQKVIAARTAVGMSQLDLANETGLSQSTIQHIETGMKTASRLELVVIADSCGVLVDDLRDTNTIAAEARCTNHATENGSEELTEYLLYAFGVARRLDQLGISSSSQFSETRTSHEMHLEVK